MFDKILVPLDLTEKNAACVDMAARMARTNQATIVLLHVIQTIAHLEFEEDRAFYQKLEERAKQKLEVLAQPLVKAGLDFRVEIRYGQPVKEITLAASKEDIDIAILNSRKLDPQNPIEGWGSVSYKVALLTDTPILLVR